MIYTHRCMFVSAVFTPLAQALCAGLAAGGAGSNMFLRGLSATGTDPATHYISSGMIEDAFADLLPLTTFDAEGIQTTRTGQPETVVALAQGMVTLAQINALFAAIDVTEQEPFTAMARLGLQIVRTT